VHPIGAQGFNLGLRDALTLAELVAAAPDPGAADLLERYAARRVPDREGTMAMSHGLVRLACLPQPLPPLQRALARRGMGFRGEPPLAVLEHLP
jgi:2-octaprenyl-6-methoxyphenol hydroxylase